AASPGLAVPPTPDGGIRLSDERLWDESTRPTGPAPDPGRAYSPRQATMGRHLVDVHDHFRAELGQLRELIEQVAAGAMDPGAARSHINVMTMRQNNCAVGAYCESDSREGPTHHTIDDTH